MIDFCSKEKILNKINIDINNVLFLNFKKVIEVDVGRIKKEI